MRFDKIILIFVFLVINCKQYEVKIKEDKIQPNENINSQCPKNHDEFIQHFIFNKFDVIQNRTKLLADYYPSSNERRIDLFFPYIKNLGGGYIGVGTDQNFTFIAWAKSDYAYLIDFELIAVYVNRLHILFFQHSENFDEFKNYWSLKNSHTSLKLIEQEIQDQEEKKMYIKTFYKAVQAVQNRFDDFKYMSKNFNFQSFHNNEEDFLYIKKLISENKIYPVLGDINGTITFQEINHASKKLCIPIRVLYLSNAEEYYRYPKTFRDNIKNMFYDEHSLVLRTVTTGAKIFGYPNGEKFPYIPFHYNIQKVQNLIDWFSIEKLWIYNMLKYRKDIESGLSILEKNPEEVGLIKINSLLYTTEK